MSIFNDIERAKENFRRDLESEMRALADLPIERDEPLGFQTQGQGIIIGDVPPKTNATEYLKAAVGWVYACVSAIADAVARNPIGLYEVSSGGEIKPVESHPATELLDRVNNFTTRYDHMSLSQQYLELAGEAPWFVDRGKSGSGEPSSLLLLRPDLLSIEQSKDKTSSNPIGGFKYKVDPQNTINISPDELVFLKYPDPINAFRGKGTLAAAALTVDLDNYSEDYNKRFFFQGARPDMVLASDQKLNEKQKKDLRSDVKRLYTGKQNAHKTMILESGLKATPFSIAQKDMEFMDQQRFSRDKICSIFRVHKSIIAITEDVNLANAKIGEYVFAKWTIRPKLERIISQLNEFYLPMFAGTENMFFSFDDPVPADVESKLKIYDSALSRGWMTVNEVREDENLPGIGEAGDKILIPNTFQPIDMAGSIISPQASVPGGKIFTITNRKQIQKSEYKGIIARSVGGYARVMIKEGIKKLQKEEQAKAHEKVKDAEHKIDEFTRSIVKSLINKKQKQSENRKVEHKARMDHYAEVFLKYSSGFERVFRTTTQLIFENQKEKIIGRFPAKSLKDVVKVDDYLLDEEDETQIMVRVYNPLMKDIISTQGKRAAKLVGEAAFSMATESVRDYLADRSFQFSFEVNQETNRLISAALQEGVAEGEGIPALRDRVREVFDGMSKPRAERIARSEVIRASNFASNEAFEQSGVVRQVQWLATPDDRIDSECAELDGKVITLGDSFFKKGDTIGDISLDYEDIDYPPLHPNCRCTIVPIVE